MGGGMGKSNPSAGRGNFWKKIQQNHHILKKK
jgi:hypothetical protein